MEDPLALGSALASCAAPPLLTLLLCRLVRVHHRGSPPRLAGLCAVPLLALASLPRLSAIYVPSTRQVGRLAPGTVAAASPRTREPSAEADDLCGPAPPPPQLSAQPRTAIRLSLDSAIKFSPSLPFRVLLAGYVLLLLMLCALGLQTGKRQPGPAAAFTTRVMALATVVLLPALWVPGGTATQGQSKAAAPRYVAGDLSLACHPRTPRAPRTRWTARPLLGLLATSPRPVSCTTPSPTAPSLKLRPLAPLDLFLPPHAPHECPSFAPRRSGPPTRRSAPW